MESMKLLLGSKKIYSNPYFLNPMHNIELNFDLA